MTRRHSLLGKDDDDVINGIGPLVTDVKQIPPRSKARTEGESDGHNDYSN